MFHNSCTRKIPYTPVSSQHTQAQARNQTHKYETFIRLYLTFFSRGSPIRNFYLLIDDPMPSAVSETFGFDSY